MSYIVDDAIARGKKLKVDVSVDDGKTSRFEFMRLEFVEHFVGLMEIAFVLEEGNRARVDDSDKWIEIALYYMGVDDSKVFGDMHGLYPECHGVGRELWRDPQGAEALAGMIHGDMRSASSDLIPSWLLNQVMAYERDGWNIFDEWGRLTWDSGSEMGAKTPQWVASGILWR